MEVSVYDVQRECQSSGSITGCDQYSTHTLIVLYMYMYTNSSFLLGMIS